MKTFFERLFIQFEAIAHPAGGLFKASEAQRKRKARKSPSIITPSPDCFNVRGGGSKKGMHLRRTPAP
ncbi:MAG TPA: hypothetical protein VD794_13095 [Flavisolibacter sp.]|nr:hypothetical protein [Flavisolibacter sp.]